MELKTLKDIDPEACCNGIRADDLRKAIEPWLNPNNWELYEDRDGLNSFAKEVFDEDFIDIQDFEFVSKFINYWFNFVVEDLK